MAGISFAAFALLCSYALQAHGKRMGGSEISLTTNDASEPDYKVEGSNMEGVGSDADKAQRKNAAHHEPAWKGCGLKPGVEIWRIEKFHVEAWPKEKYGSFHEGDSYIVMHTKADADNNQKLVHFIHFWIGATTTADEKGTAAYKTVELDDFFDGEPVQVREAMGEESASFKQLFAGGIKYLPGGIDSGFRHVKPGVYDAKLFQVRKFKGKMTVLQAPWDKNSFNNGDSFVFDAADKIYVCHGAHASAFEKHKASSISHKREAERSGIDDEFIDIGLDGDICAALKDMDPPLNGC